MFDYRAPDFAEQVRRAARRPIRRAVDIVAAEASLAAIAKVLELGEKSESKLAVLIPVKEGDTVTNPVDKAMFTEIPPFVEKLFPGVEIIPVRTFQFQSVSSLMVKVEVHCVSNVSLRFEGPCHQG